MLRKKGESATTVLQEMFGGTGTFTQHHILTKEEMGESGRLLADCSLSVGGSVGGHVHHGDAEICYFLSGRGRVTDDEKADEVGPGDTNYVQDGHYHKIENIGTGELRYLAIILYKKNKS